MTHPRQAVRAAIRKVLCRGGTLGGIALLGATVPLQTTMAQEEEAVLEEIVVTGTAIKRANLDSALPIQTITQDEFKREGITNAGDLIASVPAMQGFITESDSVGGSGGGIRTANLRAIGSQYTLTLLDGRRMAPADSGSDTFAGANRPPPFSNTRSPDVPAVTRSRSPSPSRSINARPATSATSRAGSMLSVASTNDTGGVASFTSAGSDDLYLLASSGHVQNHCDSRGSTRGGCGMAAD